MPSAFLFARPKTLLQAVASAPRSSGFSRRALELPSPIGRVGPRAWISMCGLNGKGRVLPHFTQMRRPNRAIQVRCCSSMNREYHKQFSHELERDMEFLVFGHGGTPFLAFP